MNLSSLIYKISIALLAFLIILISAITNSFILSSISTVIFAILIFLHSLSFTNRTRLYLIVSSYLFIASAVISILQNAFIISIDSQIIIPIIHMLQMFMILLAVVNQSIKTKELKDIMYSILMSITIIIILLQLFHIINNQNMNILCSNLFVSIICIYSIANGIKRSV